MLISFECHNCRTELEVDADEGGARLPCPACQETVRVPIPRIEIGTTIGNFRIQRQLGSGGMGDVFLAKQVSMQRDVALKVLPQAMTRDTSTVERFLHEVRVSARLEHPNIVTAFEAGEDHGHYYLAMSYVDGEDLGARLKREGSIPEKEVLRYALHVASALGYAWDHFTILHRDIKPGNIMIDRNGMAKLMDMGISKCLSEGNASLTIPGVVIGTPFYMSPEQARSGADLDFRSDMYALGATMYHLLTGCVPYVGDSTVAILTSHAVDPFPSPRERNPNVSHACGRLLHCLMAKSPDERYGTWGALTEDIERVAKGLQGVMPRPVDAAANGAPGTASGGRQSCEETVSGVPVPLSSKKSEKDVLPPVLDTEKALRRFMRLRRIRRVAGTLGALLFITVISAICVYKIRTPSIRIIRDSTVSGKTGTGLTSTSVLSDRLAGSVGGSGEGRDRRVAELFPAVGVLDRFFNASVEDIMSGEFDTLRRRIAEAREDPEMQEYASQLALLGTTLRKLHAVNRHIEDSFRSQIGESVNVALSTGSITLTIRNVAPGRVSGIGSGDRPGGHQKRVMFSVSELAPAEKLARMGEESRGPAVALTMGVMRLKMGDFPAARESFAVLPAEMRQAWLRKTVSMERIAAEGRRVE